MRTSALQALLSLHRGKPGKLPPPVADFEKRLSSIERKGLEQSQACSVVGTPNAVRAGVAAFVERTGADEVIVVSHIFDHNARLRSLEITAEQVISSSLGS